MISENYNYTYTIDNIDIEQGTFVVNYIPDSEFLTPISLNTYLIEKNYFEFVDSEGNLLYSSQSEVPFVEHVKYTVDAIKPINQWRKQFMFQNNISELAGASGTMEANWNDPTPALQAIEQPIN